MLSGGGVYASGWSLVQSSPTEYDREAWIVSRPWPTRGCSTLEKGGTHGNCPSCKKHFSLQVDPELISCKFSLQRKSSSRWPFFWLHIRCDWKLDIGQRDAYYSSGSKFHPPPHPQPTLTEVSQMTRYLYVCWPHEGYLWWQPWVLEHMCTLAVIQNRRQVLRPFLANSSVVLVNWWKFFVYVFSSTSILDLLAPSFSLPLYLARSQAWSVRDVTDIIRLLLYIPRGVGSFVFCWSCSDVRNIFKSPSAGRITLKQYEITYIGLPVELKTLFCSMLLCGRTIRSSCKDCFQGAWNKTRLNLNQPRMKSVTTCFFWVRLGPFFDVIIIIIIIIIIINLMR